MLITEDKVICANAGDSRSVYGTGWTTGENEKAGKGIPLSDDHKPDNKLEEARIKAAGGFVD